MFFISTDGEENMSKHHTISEVSQKIEMHQNNDGWMFILAGSNIDSQKVGRMYGIHADNIANIGNDGPSQLIMFRSVIVKTTQTITF